MLFRNVGREKSTDLYLITIAERLSQQILPIVSAEDLVKNSKLLFSLAIAHPECVRQANVQLGFKKNYLMNWIQKDFVYVVFGRFSTSDE